MLQMKGVWLSCVGNLLYMWLNMEDNDMIGNYYG